MNVFYQWLFDVLPGTTARSRPVESEFQAVSTGFDRVQVKTDAAVRAPDGEVMAPLPSAALRANKGAFFDGGGNIIATETASSAQMIAAIAAATVAITKANEAAASAAMVTGAVNALQMLQLESGIL